MKKRLIIALIACFTIAALALAGCSGGSSGNGNPSGDANGGAQPESEFKVTPDVDKFTLESWDVEITNAEVMFDKSSGYDNLVVYTKATNTLDKERKFEPNVVVEQNGEIMVAGSITDDNGKSLFTSDNDLPLCKKDESCERVFTYKIEDYDTPIVCNFGGYTVAVEDTLVTFNVSGKQTDEAKKIAEERQAELDAKKEVSSVDLDKATVTVPEGWYVETSSGSSCQLAPENGSGYVRVQVSLRSAADECDAINGNFGGDKPVDEVTINGVTWLRMMATDKQAHLFTDSSAGGGIHMSSMHFTYEDALPVFECVTVK